MATAALRVLEAEALHYRRAWRGSVVSTFLTPILYLLAMGMGLGTLVDRGAGTAELGLPYLEFLGPGLLAATAMQVGAGDAAWPVMAGIKWRRTYDAVLATPVAVRDIVTGHLAFTGLRLTLMATWFAVVLRLFGIAPLPRGLLAVLPAVLAGLAFSAPIMAFTASLKSEQGLTNLFRFGIVPLFLFSGTFFPVEQLPDALEPLAVVTPLWHGVELIRGAAVGFPTAWHPAAHVAVLVGFLTVGLVLAVRRLERRLLR
ncbi:MAG: ABC transporter permease [Actinobacteria bacterium]|nr:ABC transporter permease [Actinomycetota bacterium]